MKARIYVSTYSKYNSGSLSGAWVNIPLTRDALSRKLRQIAENERDPEFMIQDTELPEDFRAISESENIYNLNAEIEKFLSEKKIEKMTPEMKELLEEYKKVYHDKKMLDYCIGKTSGFCKLSTGDFYVFNKPRIETEFCFCADYNGIYSEEHEKFAEEMAEHAKEKTYFIHKNMDVFRRTEKILESKDASYDFEYPDYNTRIVYIYNSNLYSRNQNHAKLCESDISLIRNLIQKEKAKFEKRLETWWKRYGSAGLRTWTYYSD